MREYRKIEKSFEKTMEAFASNAANFWVESGTEPDRELLLHRMKEVGDLLDKAARKAEDYKLPIFAISPGKIIANAMNDRSITAISEDCSNFVQDRDNLE